MAKKDLSVLVIAAFVTACGSPQTAQAPAPEPAPSPAPEPARSPASEPARSREPESTPAPAELDGAAVQKVVASAVPAIKQECWQPALDSRSAEAPPSAKLATSIDVQPDGSVGKASVGAEPTGYTGLSKCVEHALLKLRFPSSREPTTVNIPFVFGAE